MDQSLPSGVIVEARPGVESWREAAEHYNEEELAAILLMIGITNLFNLRHGA